MPHETVNQRVAGSSPADGAIFSMGYAGSSKTLALRERHCLTPMRWRYAVNAIVGSLLALAGRAAHVSKSARRMRPA